MAAYSTVYQELGSARADSIWGRAYKKAKFIKSSFPSGKTEAKFAKLMRLGAKGKAKLKLKLKVKAKGKVAAKPKVAVKGKVAAKPKVAVKAKVAAKPKVAVKAGVKKRRMQAAASTESSGPTIVASGGANVDNYKDTGLPSIEKLVEQKSAKLMSIMGILALALVFIIN